jgi:SsrA-binding protein
MSPSGRASSFCTATSSTRLAGKTKERGLTLVPTRLYFSGTRAKVEVALARGKDVGDKRQTIKEREMKREMDRAINARR